MATELSVDRYAQALRRAAPDIKATRKILIVHYNCPDHTATATELAKLVGYASYKAINTNYGRLAHIIADILGQKLETWLSILGEFEKPKGEHWKLKLRPQVIEAIRKLGWDAD